MTNADSVLYDVRQYSPSIETLLVVVMGLPTKKFLPECVNKKSSTKRRS